ncbi:MAG: hypothetical protein U0441_30245 [Polyangiaceae bacterium]
MTTASEAPRKGTPEGIFILDDDFGIWRGGSRNLNGAMALSTPHPGTPPPSGPEPSSGVRPRSGASEDLRVFAGRVLAQRRELSRRLRVPAADAEDLLQDALLLLVEADRKVVPAARWSWFTSTLHLRGMRARRDRQYARNAEPLVMAHLQAQAPPFEAPDAAVLDEQRRAAARWLLAQVHDSRRGVAELYLWQDRALEEIAADMKLSVGTVRSRWERAKEDMRAAIEREQKKQGGFAWLLPVVALLSAAWFWLLGRREDRGLSCSASARSSHRRPARALLAAAALPLLLGMEEPPRAPLSAEEDTIDARTALSYTWAPYLSTNAERERDAGISERERGTMQPGHAALSEAPQRPSEAAAEATMDRGMLVHTAAAIAAGKPDLARRFLRDHDVMFPHSPFTALRTELGVALRSLESRAP